MVSFFIIGCTMTWKAVTFSVTALVTPLTVSVPSNATGSSPSNLTQSGVD